MARTDRTTDFFTGLADRGHEPLLRKATGTVRFELRRGGRTDAWLVSIERGAIDVAHRDGAADATIRMDRAVFEKMAAGDVNAVTAMLRGEITAEGDRRLLVLVQRLFPGPSKRRSRRLIKASGSR